MRLRFELNPLGYLGDGNLYENSVASTEKNKRKGKKQQKENEARWRKENQAKVVTVSLHESLEGAFYFVLVTLDIIFKIMVGWDMKR